jgi:hypothetical protein
MLAVTELSSGADSAMTRTPLGRRCIVVGDRQGLGRTVVGTLPVEADDGPYKSPNLPSATNTLGQLDGRLTFIERARVFVRSPGITPREEVTVLEGL